MLEVCVPGGTDTKMLVFVLALEERAAVEACVACGVPYPGQRLQVCDQQFGQGLRCQVLEFLVVAGGDSRAFSRAWDNARLYSSGWLRKRTAIWDVGVSDQISDWIQAVICATPSAQDSPTSQARRHDHLSQVWPQSSTEQ
jgi:hypothetical protein